MTVRRLAASGLIALPLAVVFSHLPLQIGPQVAFIRYGLAVGLSIAAVGAVTCPARRWPLAAAFALLAGILIGLRHFRHLWGVHRWLGFVVQLNEFQIPVLLVLTGMVAVWLIIASLTRGSS